ncbi:hypothetical protein AAMO2058_000235300 [Amorphochlora amoebiformis]
MRRSASTGNTSSTGEHKRRGFRATVSNLFGLRSLLIISFLLGILINFSSTWASNKITHYRHPPGLNTSKMDELLEPHTKDGPEDAMQEVPWEPIMTPGWPAADMEKVKSEDVRTENEFLNRTVKRVDLFYDVPEEYVQFETKLKSVLEMPRTVNGPQISEEDWFPQFETGYLINVRNGFVGDNAVFGPSTKSAKELYYFSLNRWWNGYPRVYEKGSVNRTMIDIGRAISIGGWGASAFQHFVIDVLPKLGFVYEKFISPEWEKANISLITTLGRGPAPYWFLEELGIRHRTMPAMGWPVKAKFIYRATEALYPDFHPAPRLLNKARAGLYPRGVMLPIQKALGVLKEKRRDKIIMLYRGGRRSLDRKNKNELQRALQELVWEHNKEKGTSITVEKFVFRTREAARDQFSRSIVLIGPHGGAFSNMVFARPGTRIVEFIPMYDFTKKGSKERTSKYVYYGLSQACGHE